MYKKLLLPLLFLRLSSYCQETIVVWAMGAEGRKIQEMAELFEKKYPEIKVITQAIPWGAAHEKLITAVVGKIPPDVCQLGTTWMAEFQAMDALTPLEDFIKDSKIISKEKFFSGSWNTNVINGKIFGIPWYVDTRVLFYRKDLLKQAGFDSPPKTWNELKIIGKKITKDKDGDGQPDNWAIHLPSSGNTVESGEFSIFVWQNNANFLTPDNKSPNLDTVEFKEALKFYTTLFSENIAPIKAGIGIDIFQAFKDGFYSMFISGPWMIEQINKELPQLKGKWDVSVLFKGKNKKSFIGGCNLVIFKESKHKLAAWKFIEFMSTPENQVLWYKLTTDLPSLISAWDDSYFDDKPMLKVFGKQLYETQSPPAIPEWVQIAHVIELNLEKIIWTNMSQQDAIKNMTKEINAILTKTKQKYKYGTIVVLIFIILVFSGFLIFLRPKPIYTEKTRYFYIPFEPYIFIMPAIIILGIFMFLPIISSFLLSLSDFNIYTINNWKNIKFVGIENYLKIMQDPIFWKSLINTSIFVGIAVPGSIFVSLLMAMLLNQTYIKFRSLFRAAYFLPVITTLVAVAVIWKWIYNPEYGGANWLLDILNIPKQEWLRSPRTALPSLIIMAIWKNFGYNMVIFLAGLQAIPKQLYESAWVDGADEFKTFRYITFPSLRPTTFFITVTTVIGYFQFFAEPYIMTGGGPLNSTISVVLYMYNHGFKYFNLGYASSIAYILFGIIFVFTLIQLKIQKKYYED